MLSVKFESLSNYIEHNKNRSSADRTFHLERVKEIQQYEKQNGKLLSLYTIRSLLTFLSVVAVPILLFMLLFNYPIVNEYGLHWILWLMYIPLLILYSFKPRTTYVVGYYREIASYILREYKEDYEFYSGYVDDWKEVNKECEQLRQECDELRKQLELYKANE